MKRPKQRKLPARVARWAQRDRAFAALIFRHPEVAERLDTVERFRNAKDSLPSAQAVQAVGYPRPTLYGWDALYKGDLPSLVNGSRRSKTPLVRTARMSELQAAILKIHKRFAWGIEKICSTLQEAGWRVSETSDGRAVQDLLESGKIKRISYARAHKGKKQSRYDERGDGAKPTRAGELLKMDTLHVTTPSGERSASSARSTRIRNALGPRSTLPPMRPMRRTCCFASTKTSNLSKCRSTAAPSSADATRWSANISACVRSCCRRTRPG